MIGWLALGDGGIQSRARAAIDAELVSRVGAADVALPAACWES